MFQKKSRRIGVKVAGIILMFLLICAPVSLAASDVVVCDTSSFSQKSNADDISWSHTVGNGTDRMLVVGISIKAGSTADMNIKSVTFGNQDMIYVNDSSVIAGTEGEFNKTLLYYLPNPNSGTSVITVRTIGKCEEISAKANSLSNVYQGMPEAVATNTMNDANVKEITAYINTVTDNAFVVSSVANSFDTVNLNTAKMTKAGRNSVNGSSSLEGHMAISCVAFAPVSNNPKVSIAYNFSSTQQSFAVGKLERTLLALHYLPVKTNSSQASGQENIIVRLTSDKSIQPEGFKISKKAKSYVIEAADEVGAMYGVLEISEQIRNNGLANVTDEQVNPKFEFRALKINTPWSSYRYDASLDQHYETMRDVTYWESLLDMMAEQHFNKLTLWNLHPYPYMIRSTNFPKATPFTDEELAKWKFLYQNIFRMAKERGIETYLVPWNIFVSEAFKQNYDPKGRTDMMGYKGNAYITPEINQYSKENVTQVLNEYPNLTGFGLSVDENMGGMTPEQREEWIFKTYVEGMKAASRTVPAKLIHKMPASGDATSDGVSADNRKLEVMTHNAMESITGVTFPIATVLKFNGSHGYSSTKLLQTHGGAISDGYWNPLPEKYRIEWMIRNEDFYILRWAQPDFIREHIANNDQSYVGGYFVGTENYYPALNYIDIQNSSDNWTNYGFQRQWMFYMTWGRLLYNPKTPDTAFAAAFDQRYGNNVGDKLLKAYKLASDFPTLFGAYTKTSWDLTSHAEGFLVPENLGFDDKKSPFYSLEELMQHPVLDTEYLSIQDYAGYVNNNKPIPAGKITPLQLADTLDRNAQEALKNVNGLSSANPAFQQEIGDIQAWCYMSRYFADKLRAGVALAKYDANHDPENKAQALAYITSAKSHWDNVVLGTESRYKAIGMPHISKHDKAYKFSWRNDIPELETKFSWKNYVPEVEKDIDFVKER